LTLADLSGAAQRYPLVALTFTLGVLGLAGLPPLAGFMSKWQIFAAGFESQNAWITALVIFAALNSVLSLAYYLPLVNALFRHQLSPVVERRIPTTMLIPLVVLALATITIGLWPGLVGWLTEPAGAAIVAVFSR
jgi:NADH:ubiquinone oxidoreductase subunit 2 (subunit N)